MRLSHAIYVLNKVSPQIMFDEDKRHIAFTFIKSLFPKLKERNFYEYIKRYSKSRPKSYDPDKVELLVNDWIDYYYCCTTELKRKE